MREVCLAYPGTKNPACGRQFLLTHVGCAILVQELLTELPNDTCAIPEPPDIPVIPEPEERNAGSDTPPASVSGAPLVLSDLHQSSLSASGGDQTRIHTTGQDR